MLNKLGRGLPGDTLHTKHQKLYVFQFQRRRVLRYSFFVPMFELVNLGAGPVLTLGASFERRGRDPLGYATYMLNKLGGGRPGDALHTKYQRLYVFQFQRRRVLRYFFFVPMFELVTPVARACIDPLGLYTTNKISKLYAFQFQRARILNFSFFVPC